MSSNHAMTRSFPTATLLVLPDLRPLGQRLAAVLRHLAPGAAEDLHRDAERLGRAVVFQGDLAEAERLHRELKAAGLTTSLNLRHDNGAAS
jgi:predicted deacylase